MGISQLSLTNFRSYAEQTIALDPSTTLVVGANATGKTNLLESLFVLATTRSFRAKDAELIRHRQSFYRISAELDGTELAMGYQLGERGAEKRVRHSSVAKSLIDHLGTIRVVLFEPGDLLLITGGPDRRRRYLDFVLTQTDKRYAKTLNQYRRVLLQRNRLLSDWRGNTSELFAWNVQLAQAATDIDARRRELVEHLNTLVRESYARIAGSTEPTGLAYVGSCPTGADYATNFLQQLETGLSRDIGAGFTTIGPHRDDFNITFKNAPITAVASRGEMRTVVLSLKLAELAYIEQHAGTKPLLLLDDVFSELDNARRRFLLATLGDYQAVLTTTSADVSEQLATAHTIISTKDWAAPASKAPTKARHE